MTQFLVFRAAMVWLAIACLAVVNGIIREQLIAPGLGESIALPLSGFVLSIAVFAVTYFTFNFLGAKAKSACLFIGAQWVLMTLTFEFIVGYFVAGKPWSVLLQVFNLAEGDLFSLVLLVSLLSPCLVARIKAAS